MFYIFLLFLLFPINVQAETIYTPYYETQTPTYNNELEKQEEKEIYYFLKPSKKTKDYYSIDFHKEGYEPILEDFIYTPYSKIHTHCKEMDGVEIKWMKKVTYQTLKPIQKIILESKEKILLQKIEVTIRGEKVPIQILPSFTKEKRKWILLLPQKTNLEEIELFLTCFVRQDLQSANLFITDNEKISFQKIGLSKKGFSLQKILLTKEIVNYKMGEKKTSFLEQKEELPYFYTSILKVDSLCQKRKKKYRFEKKGALLEKETPFVENAIFLKKEKKMKYYRREKIVLKEPLITKTPYLLVDDFIESTSFPLKDLKIIHSSIKEEGIYPILFSYRDFQFEKTFLYQKNEKENF